jgi:DMSO/TMAO reductase YedYZ molybdopterin-dependent catalytic subunit
MPIRTRTPSIFRPRKAIDQDVLRENRALVDDINRRNVLRGAISLGALSLLTGCDVDVTESAPVQRVLRAVSSWNDRVQEAIFRPNHLAPTFDASQVVKPPRFNAYYDIEDVKPVDGATWKLELAGRIEDKRPWTAQQIDQLPEQELIIRHICVEGWDYIGQWSGPNLRSFLQRIGADLTAKYIAFKCADDYTESIDMQTALHPQTILATKYANAAIADPFGYPLRLRTATTLGYKNPKWITAMEVTNAFTETFWSKQGFNWFAGI